MCIKKDMDQFGNTKDEALRRMKLLNLHSNAIQEFKQDNKLNKSEALGNLFWLTEDEKKIVEEFEQKNQNILVYHLVKTVTKEFGIVYDLLYLENDENDWEEDRYWLKDDFVLSHTITQFPESGLIKVKRINGGLVRAY